MLSDNEEELSNKFARAKGDKWIGQTLLNGRTGLPLLPNAVIAFECEAYDRHDGGDHEIFVGRVVELHENQTKRGLRSCSSAASIGDWALPKQMRRPTLLISFTGGKALWRSTKKHDEFHILNMNSGWETPRGYPKGI